MEHLNNDQYDNFILTQVVRPYLNVLYDDHPYVEKIGYSNRSTSMATFEYSSLYDLAMLNPEWLEMVTSRLSKIYSQIDFSFFPEDEFADLLKMELVAKGIFPVIRAITIKKIATP